LVRTYADYIRRPPCYLGHSAGTLVRDVGASGEATNNRAQASCPIDTRMPRTTTAPPHHLHSGHPAPLHPRAQPIPIWPPVGSSA
jgi:hypothetical protein